jgi:hypothetical protein
MQRRTANGKRGKKRPASPPEPRPSEAPDTEPQAERTRTDWERNHGLIRDAMLKLIDEQKGKLPSQDEIADRAGLARVTVQRHMKEMDLSSIARPFRVLADTVLLGLANKAVRGDAAAAKLYFQLTFGPSESGRTPPSDGEH